jgi:hypothetical protein
MGLAIVSGGKATEQLSGGNHGQARLLGRQLLDICAPILVASAAPDLTVTAVDSRNRVVPGGDGDQEMQRRIDTSPVAPAPPALADPVRLIAEG